MDKGRLGEVKYQAQSPSSHYTNFWTQTWVGIWLWKWGHYLCVLFSLQFTAVEGIIAVPVRLHVGKSCCLPSFKKTETLPGLASSWLSWRECWPPWLQESSRKLHDKTIAGCSAPTVRGQFHFSWPELQGPWAPCDAASLVCFYFIVQFKALFGYLLCLPVSCRKVFVLLLMLKQSLGKVFWFDG